MNTAQISIIGTTIIIVVVALLTYVDAVEKNAQHAEQMHIMECIHVMQQMGSGAFVNQIDRDWYDDHCRHYGKNNDEKES